jgi:hypothetical protein
MKKKVMTGTIEEVKKLKMNKLVLVERDELYYACFINFQGKWKCGYCLHGVIKPKKHFKCRVCKAKVIDIKKKGVYYNEC